MRRAPAFWQRDGLPARLLAPLEGITARLTAARVARPGWRAPVPVICCGNASVGGAGKTPLALELCARLQARGIAVHVLSRGFGRRAGGALLVEPGRHGAAEVGDEPLLLAQVAPTWVGADRAATARAAVAAGAQALLMDDGLQNPGLVKDCALLVIDGGAGFGNGRLLPAGPLRESVADAAARCRAAVMVGADMRGAAAMLPAGFAVLGARLEPGAVMAELAGKRVVAFAGIGRPEKFFDMLAAGGVELAGRVGFADHHVYGAGALAGLRARAAQAGALLVTTRKDFVRLGAEDRVGILAVDVALRWDDAGQIEALLDGVFA